MPVPAYRKESAEEQVFPGRYITLAEAQELLQREQEERMDLTYEQKLSLDHADHFIRMPPEVAREVATKLQDLGLTEAQAAKLADLGPSHEDDVRAVFAKDRMTPEPDVIKQILELFEVLEL